MSRFKVLITDRFDIDALATLKGDSRIETKITQSHVPTPEECSWADAMIIRSRTRIDSHLLAMAPHLKLLITATSGFDHIDLSATEAAGLHVMHTPEANAASACELTWSLVLACVRKIPDAHRAVKSGDWRRESLLGHQLSGKTYGVVGLGRIGTRVARIAKAFGMSVVAFDPYKEDEHYHREGVTRVGLEELLKLSDVISFHVPKTSETHHMVSLANLEAMNKGVVFVNTSRGSAISEEALVLALREGWIGACGLDVFEREPLPRQSDLNSLPNVVLTPHIGATTAEAFAQASQEAALKIQAFLENGSLSDTLPPTDSWYREAVSSN